MEMMKLDVSSMRAAALGAPKNTADQTLQARHMGEVHLADGYRVAVALTVNR